MEIKFDPKQERQLSRKELSERWNLSIKTLKRREKEGILRPLSLGARTVRYRLSEILAIEEDAAAK
jgi:predicted DNA-binding transcriptional regulator AlpA